jgi:hypothetical protein
VKHKEEMKFSEGLEGPPSFDEFTKLSDKHQNVKDGIKTFNIKYKDCCSLDFSKLVEDNKLKV